MTILIPASTGYGGVRHIPVSLPRVDFLLADQPAKYALPTLPGGASSRTSQRAAARAGPPGTIARPAATASSASSRSWPRCWAIQYDHGQATISAIATIATTITMKITAS